MANYDISELTKPKKDEAHIEFFFTRKGKNLYCIVPSYTPQIRIKNFKALTGANALLLSGNKPVRWKQEGNDCIIDLSKM